MAKSWPEGQEELDAYNDWRYEVNDGSTLRGFREWLRAGQEEED